MVSASEPDSSRESREAYARMRAASAAGGWTEPGAGSRGGYSGPSADQWCFGMALLAAAASSGPAIANGDWKQANTETLAAEWAELIKAGGQ